MAYENMTYEVILKRMIDRVSNNYPNLDTREGSIIFNALAPAAIELAIMYTELDNCINESFVNTASREYLLLACEQMGMDTAVFNAGVGIHKGEFNVAVTLGSRWNCDIYNYRVIDYIGQENGYHYYKLACETYGTSPNNVVGDLTAITDLPDGLTHAKLVECLIEGESESTDEEIRVAYVDYVNNSATDGNLNQYTNWCNGYKGVGNSKIIPLWNGANTVKVSILGSSNRAASEELINEFQEYLDPNSEGMGNGVAPIGSIVTVSTATEVPIDVMATIKLKDGYTDTSPIDDALAQYFSEIAYAKTTVSYMTLGAVILNTGCVESVDNLELDWGEGNTVGNFTLGVEEIPVLGATNWEVL